MPPSKIQSVSLSFKIAIINIMILAGALNTLAYKFQNTQTVYQGPYFKLFFHPYMQATTMFFGQFLSLLVYFVIKNRNPQKYKTQQLQARTQGKQIKINILLFIIPATCDFVASTLQYISLNFIAGSVYQMMRGGTIVVTLILSKFFLKQQIHKFQIIGSILAIFGIFLVGLSNVIFSDSSGSQQSGFQILALVLLLISLFFQGFFFIFQQKLFKKYHLHPLQVVGYQGLFGLCIQAVFLPIANFIPCGLGVKACVVTDEGYPFVQRVSVYFRQIFDVGAGALLFFCCLGVFSIASFNISGATVTKYINATSRSICDVTRTIVVWGVGLIVAGTAGRSYPNYKWELISAGAIVIQLIGFIILIAGNLIYNQIVKLPKLRWPLTKSEKDQSLLGSVEGQQHYKDEEKQQKEIL